MLNVCPEKLEATRGTRQEKSYVVSCGGTFKYDTLKSQSQEEHKFKARIAHVFKRAGKIDQQVKVLLQI